MNSFGPISAKNLSMCPVLGDNSSFWNQLIPLKSVHSFRFELTLLISGLKGCFTEGGKIPPGTSVRVRIRRGVFLVSPVHAQVMGWCTRTAVSHSCVLATCSWARCKRLQLNTKPSEKLGCISCSRFISFAVEYVLFFRVCLRKETGSLG